MSTPRKDVFQKALDVFRSPVKERRTQTVSSPWIDPQKSQDVDFPVSFNRDSRDLKIFRITDRNVKEVEDALRTIFSNFREHE